MPRSLGRNGAGTRPIPGYRIKADTRQGRYEVIPPEGESWITENWAMAYASIAGHRRGMLVARKLANDAGNAETVAAIDEVLARRFL